MAKKKENEETEEMLFRVLYPRRNLFLKMPTGKGESDKTIQFTSGQYRTSDPKIIDFLDNHMYRQGSEANEKHGGLSYFGRAEDVSVVMPSEHKAVKEKLDETEDKLAKAKEETEEMKKKLRAQKAALNRRNKKLKELGEDVPEDDEDL